MSAASKHTAFAAASFLLLVALAISGAASARPHAGGNHDRTPPSAPTNLRATSATPSSVSLAWNASTDNVGVAGYYLYVANQKRTRVSGTSYNAIGLSCGQTVDVWIVAFDTSNNRSLSTSATVSTAACPDLQAPTAPTGFVQRATTQTGAVLAWAASSDNVGVVGYDVYRNLGLVSNAAQPTATLGGLTCGSAYQYQVDAYDAAGNHSARSSVWLQTATCGDSQAPTAPTGLKVTAHTATSLSLAWSASTDDVGVAGYSVSVNGSTRTVTGTSTTVSLLSCGTTYSVSVDAFDAAGNHSSAAATNAATDACATPTPPPSPPPPPPGDTTAPTQPGSLAVSSAAATSVSLTWSASTDAVGVTGYGVYRDGTSVASVTQPGATVSGLTCGTSYTFAVDAYDAAGNHSTKAQVTGSTAACSAPAPPPPAPGDTTAPTQPGSLAVSSAAATSVSLTWSASTDAVGVTGYGVYRDGTSVASVTQPGATVSGLTCGTSYTFAVDAYDAAGNHSTKAQVTSSTAACADAQAPTAPGNVVATSRTATSIALSWSAASDNVGVTGYGLYKNGTQVTTVTGTTGIFSGLTCNANYTLAVDAYDAAGNHSSKTTVMVATTACPDSTPPSMPTGLATSNATQTSLNFSWNASTDNVAVTGYDVYRNGTKMATASSTSSTQTGLACGTSYTFAVDAYDAAGNSSPQAQVTGSTSACSQPPPPPPPPSGAALALSASGNDSTCVRGDLTKPCASFNGAYQKAQCGDVVQISAGSYGDQRLSSSSKSCSGSYVVFKPASGASVTVSNITVESGEAGWVEINGFKLSQVLRIAAANWRVIGIDGGSFDYNGTNIYSHGNDWGPCDSSGPINCGHQNFIGSLDSNLVIDGDTFHDYNITPGSGDHWECVYATGTTGPTTIQNSRFYGCTTYDIYFTGFDSSIHFYKDTTTIQNNWFGRSCNDAACTTPRQSAINFGGSDIGGPKKLLIRYNSFAPGQSVVDESSNNTDSSSRIIGNILGAGGCLPNVVYSYNIFLSGTPCGANATNAATPYVNSSGGATGDYHLAGTTIADGYVVPTTSDYALGTDFDGRSRSAPRAGGADEP